MTVPGVAPKFLLGTRPRPDFTLARPTFGARATRAARYTLAHGANAFGASRSASMSSG
jgi:hypothetical protein